MVSRSSFQQVDEWEKVEGSPWPFGVTWIESQEAYNFALFSHHARGVALLLYVRTDPAVPVYRYVFDPIYNRTGPIWHCLLPAAKLQGATLYGYRVEGPFDSAAGHRFDSEKVLLDPFASAVHFPRGYSRAAAGNPGPTDGLAPLGVLPSRHRTFDADQETQPRHTHDLIVYELHVKGFTARPNSDVSPDKRGTFAGLVEKIPYILALGATAVELLPVQQFDPQEGSYWGYMTLNFFSPHHTYASGDAFLEFREMVRSFHAAGIEVWLDVVYNHTSEAGPDGPTYCYRGIDNKSYYILREESGEYFNDTGCGNTLKCAHPIVRGLVLLSLRYWVKNMRVDGFRFDLASIFARTVDGSINTLDSPLIAEIDFQGYTYDLRLIAEAWDIGAYLLGRNFPGLQWRQWNGKFRDDIRSFVKGDPGKVADLMRRLYGSDDLFPEGPDEVYRPWQSVNFVTAHDGFCLYDLVSFNRKHNEANGHNNTDGPDDNLSWNCGWEGDENVPEEVMSLRRQQVKNFFCLLMLANGTPMFCAGDEFMNTQQGNNNPYNQDNETTWLNWDLLEPNADIFRFFKRMILFRKSHSSIARSHFWRGSVRWYGSTGAPDLSYDSHCLAYCLDGGSFCGSDIYVMINGYWKDVSFVIQEGGATGWLRVVDTSRPSPEDICEPGGGVPVESLQYTVGARSIVVLERESACFRVPPAG